MNEIPLATPQPKPKPAEEEKVARSRRLKPLLPPAVLQPTPMPPVIAKETTVEALKTTEQVLSSLSAPRGDDRLDAVTAEDFFSAPAEDAAPVEPASGAPAPVQAEPPMASLPVQTTQPIAPLPVQPSQSIAPLPVQPSQSIAPLPVQPVQPITPLPVQPVQPIAPLPSQNMLPTQPITPRSIPEICPLSPSTPNAASHPFTPSPVSPMPFMPSDTSSTMSREVHVSYGSHCLLTHVPHTNLDALSLSSFSGPLTQGRQKEKVVQWLETQKRESTRFWRFTCSDRWRLEAALEHPPDPGGKQRRGGTQSQLLHA